MSTSPYHQAGKLLQQIISEKKSINTVAFSKSKLLCTKATYAQVCNTIQHKSLIDSILNHNSGHLRKSIQMNTFKDVSLVYVLLYELLFGKYHGIRGGGKIKRCIMKFEKELIETKNKIVKESQGTGGKKIPEFPRYVRVNKLKAETEEVVNTLKKTMEDSNEENMSGRNNIYQDAHVPDVLVISPKASIKWYESEIVKAGKVVLQDKSSCFSGLALVHGSDEKSIGDQAYNDGDFIDATAAPGNKTLHIAALVYDKIMKKKVGERKAAKNQKSVKIFAFDRSSARMSILKDRLSKLAPSVLLHDDEIINKKKQKNSFPVDICPRHEDFLKSDPKDKKYKNVRNILLDPSCSGSGIVNSLDRIADTKDDKTEEQRIESLSNFQIVALKHAMSFPQCLRIVYSTCSINQRENEDVVAAALDETNEKIGDENMKWELVSPMALKHWKRRGLKVDGLTKEQSECLIRVDGMDGDNTNGFFVSYFERKKARSEKQSHSPNLIDHTIIGIKGTYNGEFTSKCNEEGGTLKKDDKDQKEVTKSKKAKKEENIKPQPKKAAKKMLWKQKQKEMKVDRLKKKRSNKINK